MELHKTEAAIQEAACAAFAYLAGHEPPDLGLGKGGECQLVNACQLWLGQGCPPVEGRVWCLASRCRANVAHTRQSGPDYGLGIQVKVLITF